MFLLALLVILYSILKPVQTREQLIVLVDISALYAS